MSGYLIHYGIPGQKHGVRRFQNIDGSLTPAGKRRYGIGNFDSSAQSFDNQQFAQGIKDQMQQKQEEYQTSKEEYQAFKDDNEKQKQEIDAKGEAIQRENERLKEATKPAMDVITSKEFINTFTTALKNFPKRFEETSKKIINNQNIVSKKVSQIGSIFDNWFSKILKHDDIYVSDIDDYLAHYGILGMKHGVRNGPPYPLNSEGKAAFREQRRQERAERREIRQAKKAHRTYVRDTKQYIRNKAKRSEIEGRRQNNYVNYAIQQATGRAAVGIGGTIATAASRTESGAGTFKDNMAMGLAMMGAATAASTAMAVNKKRQVDSINYDKLTRKISDYEAKYSTLVSQINQPQSNQNKPRSGNSYDHDLARRDPATLSNKDLSKAIERKRLESQYQYSSRNPEQEFAKQLGKNALDAFTTTAAKNAANKIFGTKSNDDKRHKK